MIRSIFVLAFLLGSAAIITMCVIFASTSPFALVITFVIGAVYSIGTVELLQFRKATSTLSVLLHDSHEKIVDLKDWTAKLHPSLQNSVYGRIEGEKNGLPAPILTPYLIGLLVMLGLLGTFVGMVDTLQGAVSALEGSAELASIRAGLAAPIEGLGLAFGTSVAGVSASAMLGLMSTLARRDRIMETRILDSKITTILSHFSLNFNRHKAYTALQEQVKFLPDVMDRMDSMTQKIETMGNDLSAKLSTEQVEFHRSAASSYEGLAKSVTTSLKSSLQTLDQSLRESGRLVGEGIKPVVSQSMSDLSTLISEHSVKTYKDLSDRSDKQLERLTDSFDQTSKSVNLAWKQGVSAYEKQHFEIQDISSKREQARFEQLDASFEKSREQSRVQMEQTSIELVQKIEQVAAAQQEVIENIIHRLDSNTSTLAMEWRKSGLEQHDRQLSVSSMLETSGQAMLDNAAAASNELLGKMNSLFKASEELVTTRIANEETWASGHEERMKSLAQTISGELRELRDDESRRADAAVSHLSELQSVLATQLATLGQSLEEPMSALIETASEAPSAAAEIITQLKREISNNIERDNGLLQDRQRIMQELDALTVSMTEASNKQRDMVDGLVRQSTTMLDKASQQFDQHLHNETSKLKEIVAHFEGSSVEISSLGETFSFAVNLFNEANEKTVSNLNRIELSMSQSSDRSDEQLSYYIAQARELIDHSMMSQKALFERLETIPGVNIEANTSVANDTESLEVS